MIPIMEPQIDHQEIDRVLDCLKTGWISSQGSYIPEFEKTFAEYCGSGYGIATSNGTTALHLALVTLGLSPGDEVIVPALSFIATANAVTYCGAKPVFVDVNPRNWTMDPEALRVLITPRTKAIIPVHLYGHPADMDPILEIASEFRIWVIEDAAEAHGAEYKGKKVGSLGHAGCFSFYGNKIISTGEGGMMVTDNPEWAEKARMLRDHGMSKERKYWHPCIGFNYRMTNIQAAIGLGQMTKIEAIIRRKKEIADYYRRRLENLPAINLPLEEPWAKHVFWLFSVSLSPEFKKDRDGLIAFLAEQDIESRPVFYPIPSMPPYQGYGVFPVTEMISKSSLSLPSGAGLTREQMDQVANRIEKYLLA
jgi:perosamine synthetase